MIETMNSLALRQLLQMSARIKSLPLAKIIVDTLENEYHLPPTFIIYLFCLAEKGRATQVLSLMQSLFHTQSLFQETVWHPLKALSQAAISTQTKKHQLTQAFYERLQAVNALSEKIALTRLINVYYPLTPIECSLEKKQAQALNLIQKALTFLPHPPDWDPHLSQAIQSLMEILAHQSESA